MSSSSSEDETVPQEQNFTTSDVVELSALKAVQWKLGMKFTGEKYSWLMVGQLKGQIVDGHPSKGVRGQAFLTEAEVDRLLELADDLRAALNEAKTKEKARRRKVKRAMEEQAKMVKAARGGYGGGRGGYGFKKSRY